MTFAKGDAIYVDESYAKDYYVVATAISPANLPETARALRTLLLGNQRSLHFKAEKPARRVQLLRAIAELDVRCAIWVKAGVPPKTGRRACIRAIADAAVADEVSTLHLERDASLEKFDRQLIAEAVSRSGNRCDLRYGHLPRHAHPLLWVSDAVAWSYAAGGNWRRRVLPLMGERFYRL